MKIICNRETLANAFALAQNAVKSQSPKPILRNVKLEVANNEIILFATDMEMGIRVTLPCEEIQDPGCIMLPADRVMALLRESRAETVTIESDRTKTVISADSRFVFATEDPDEFPGTPIFEENNYIVTKARYIKEGIRRTIFATDSESGRFALSGVLMDYKDNTLSFVSTDGRRMAAQQVEASVQGEYPSEKTAVATVRSLTLLDRLLQHGDADVSIVLQDSSFMIQSENVFYYASLLEGRFPEWRAAIGQLRNPQSVELPIPLFSQAIRLASIVTDKASPGVVMELENNQMTVSALNIERGEMEKSFALDYPEGEMAMKLNGEYIAAFLKTVSEDTVVKMNFVDERTGVLFETNDGYRYLVMPMQLDRKKKVESNQEDVQETDE